MEPSQLSEIMSQDIGYNPELKLAFLNEARRMLRVLAERLGLRPSQYDLRTNEGGVAVSGEVTLHSDHLYIQISQTIPDKGILFRTCDGRQDYSGHQNNFAKVDQLSPNNIDGFVEKIAAMSKITTLH